MPERNATGPSIPVVPEAGADREWVDCPVYVTGLMKTGSTMLLGLLDGHPEVLAYPDEPSFDRIFLKSYRGVRHLITDWMYGTPNPLHFGQLMEEQGRFPAGWTVKSWVPLPEDFRERVPRPEEVSRELRLRGVSVEDERAVIDLEAYHASLRERLDPQTIRCTRDIVVQTILALRDASRVSRCPKRWLFKQPMPYYRPASLQWFFGNFPLGKAVLLMRDPRAYINSFMRHRERRDGIERGWPRLWRMAFVVQTLRNLERDYRLLLQAPAVWGEDRISIVYYEDLVLKTEEEMRDLAGFIGVKFDEVLTTPTKVGRTVQVITATEPGATRVYSGSLEKWKQELSGLQIALVDAAMDGYYQISEGRHQPVVPWPFRKALRLLLLLAYTILDTVAGLSNRFRGNPIRTDVPGVG